jgi:hypothetical protein
MEYDIHQKQITVHHLIIINHSLDNLQSQSRPTSYQDKKP